MRPSAQRLAADLAGGHVDDPVAGELLRGLDGLLDAVDEGERGGVGVLPVLRRFVGDHEDVLTGGRHAVPAVGQVEQTAPDDDGRDDVYVARMKSADAWVVCDLVVLPSKDQLTSPLPNQSNSGPTPSLSSAM